MAAQVNLDGREVLIAVRTYLDSSSSPKRMTLAAVSSTDGLWAAMEESWNSVLAEHPLKPQYVHMKEIIKLVGTFDKAKGWTLEEAFGIVNKMLLFLQMFPKKDFQMFYCTVDSEARNKLISEGYKIPSAVELCNGYCSETVLKVHLHKYVEADPYAEYKDCDQVMFFFDQGEKFFGPFHAKWQRERKRAFHKREWSPWSIVSQVAATSQMKKLPGLQIADILAWCVNRENTVDDGYPGKHYAHIIRQIVAHYRIDFDETMLRRKYGQVIIP